MSAKTGNLSINSENMLPIIKKWLYSDHDIFIREQISNACDAVTKLKKLEGVGEYRPADGHTYEIHVEVDPDEKTLTFKDNGIGMTADEVVEYITQIAFSGASAFLEKYKDQAVRFRLEVEEENERAVAVYKKAGYHPLPYMQMTKEQ